MRGDYVCSFTVIEFLQYCHYILCATLVEACGLEAVAWNKVTPLYSLNKYVQCTCIYCVYVCKLYPNYVRVVINTTIYPYSIVAAFKLSTLICLCYCLYIRYVCMYFTENAQNHNVYMYSGNNFDRWNTCISNVLWYYIYKYVTLPKKHYYWKLTFLVVMTLF